MASAREMRLRIRSVGNIAQVTRALQAVSASRAQQSVQAPRPYATKAWEVLQHLASQPARDVAHPLLTQRTEVRRITVVVITSDRGLAGASNANLIRHCLESFRGAAAPVTYVFVGRKGRDMMTRRRIDVRADFSGLP